MNKYGAITSSIALSFSMFSSSAVVYAGDDGHHHPCNQLASHAKLKDVLQHAIAPTTDGAITNGGFELNMWATLMDNDGTVCAVAKSGNKINDQWLGSRVRYCRLHCPLGKWLSKLASMPGCAHVQPALQSARIQLQCNQNRLTDTK